MTSAFIIKNLFMLIVITGIITDIIWMLLPNWLFIAFAVLFAATCYFFGIEWEMIKGHLWAILVVLLVGFPLFAVAQGKLVGAGDVKFAMGIAMWIGLGPTLLDFFILTGLFGLPLILAFFAIKKFDLLDYLPQKSYLSALRSSVNKTPYGVALGAAALFLMDKFPIFQLISN